MGGKVSVDSTVDVGTTFTIDLLAKANDPREMESDYLEEEQAEEDQIE